MQTKRWMMLAGLACLLALPASNGYVAAQAGPRPAAAPAAVPALGTTPWTWDQQNTTAAPVPDAVDSNASTPTWAADDFQVPSDDSAAWLVVDQLRVRGSMQNWTGAIGTANVCFYLDAAGMPAANGDCSVVSFSPSNASAGPSYPSISSLDFYMTLALPPRIFVEGSGTHWVSMQVNSVSYAWLWRVNTLQAGTNGSVFKSPTAYEGQCTNWTRRTGLCGGAPEGAADLSFSLSGQVVTGIDKTFLPIILR